MYQIPPMTVARWSSSYETHVPSAIDAICPLCRKMVTFILNNWDSHEVKGQPKTIRCPRCSESTDFLRLGGKNKKDARIFIDADLPERTPLAGLKDVPDEILSATLKREYEEALSVYAIGAANATAITCRRILEGVTASFVPEDSRNNSLYRQIQELAQQHEALSRPLIELSDVLRRGGNRGAHYSEDEGTTLEGAAQLIELLEYLLNYLYILPAQVKQFSENILRETSTSENDTAS